MFDSCCDGQERIADVRIHIFRWGLTCEVNFNVLAIRQSIQSWAGNWGWDARLQIQFDTAEIWLSIVLVDKAVFVQVEGKDRRHSQTPTISVRKHAALLCKFNHMLETT